MSPLCHTVTTRDLSGILRSLMGERGMMAEEGLEERRGEKRRGRTATAATEWKERGEVKGRDEIERGR